MNEIDCRSTDQIVCPYCGYEFTDSYELGEDGDVECDECGQTFNFTSDTVVYYTSTRDCELNGVEHEWQDTKQYDDSTLQECKKCDRFRFVPKEKQEVYKWRKQRPH